MASNAVPAPSADWSATTVAKLTSVGLFFWIAKRNAFAQRIAAPASARGLVSCCLHNAENQAAELARKQEVAISSISLRTKLEMVSWRISSERPVCLSGIWNG